MVEDADVAVLAEQVCRLDPAEVDRVVKIDGVGADDLEPEFLVPEGDAGDQRVLLVGQRACPRVVFDPGKLAVGPDAEVLHVPKRVVVVPDPGVIDVADAVELVEVDQEVAVADREIACHVAGEYRADRTGVRTKKQDAHSTEQPRCADRDN